MKKERENVKMKKLTVALVVALVVAVVRDIQETFIEDDEDYWLD